jgi:polysaccharide biosynthesis transport protein
VAENTTDPKTTQAWAQLVMRKAALEGELTHLRQELREKHPDIITKQAEVDQVQKEMDQQVSEWKDKIKEKQEKLEKRPDFTLSGTEAEIKLVEGEIKREQTWLDDNEKQIAGILQRINSVPGAEVALGALEREYQTKKGAYDQLLGQQRGINLNRDAASQQQGEGIELVDPANLPSKPVAPKRFMLTGVGLAVGLGIGLFLAGIFEVPRLLTIQSAEDARHYTGLPVLISVPELRTPEEARSVPRRRRLLLAAGVAAAILSIPLLALALKATHIFEFLMNASGRAA